MKTHSMWLAVMLCSASPALVASDAERIVGTATLELQNAANGRKVVSELWFEAATGAKVQDYSPRAPLRAISIARGANPSTAHGKRPLVVISHGNWGSRYSQGWLALHLVRSGYVVLSTSHPGTLGDDQTAAGRYRLWDRSRDVSFALDEALKDPRGSALIDERRIAFVGHSFGGWTGVSLAGATYDPAQQRRWCDKSAQKDFYCEGTLKDDVASLTHDDAGVSFKDTRFKAFYIMASGPAQGFVVESLKSIDVPFVVDTARFDEILEPEANSSTLARHIRGAKSIVRPVGHFAYVPEYRPVIGPLLAKVAGVPLCDDPKGVDRAAVHRQVARDVTEFLDRVLSRSL